MVLVVFPALEAIVMQSLLLLLLLISLRNPIFTATNITAHIIIIIFVVVVFVEGGVCGLLGRPDYLKRVILLLLSLL